MSDADWLKAILAAVGVIVVAPWATWISRSAAGALSREEHRKLCEEREERVASDLAEIKRMMRDNNREAIDSRHKLSNRVQELALDIAILSRKPRSDQDTPEWPR